MAKTAEALLSAVEGDAAAQTNLGATPATRFYPSRLPQKPALPAATYQRIGGVPVGSYDGLNPLDGGLYQIDVYAETAKAARDAADAMRDAIDRSAALGAVFTNVLTGFEPDPRLYRVSMDVTFLHTES